ncbi:hypothetical protein ACFSJ3_08125 [Corallincola platygyrae]|uniref:Uncharacterized protein n=1 Tax=Corallincola platygyrae TaxID=1193278 RepID=A0ABW4XK85_9GAMM
MTPTGILVSLLTSVLGGIVVFYFIRYRDSQILRKIDAINSEEEFVEKLSKGSTKLLRSTFATILISMAMGFAAATIILTFLTYSTPLQLLKYGYGVGAWLTFVASGLCFLHTRAIIRSADMKSTRTQFQAQREKLEKKLS